MGCHVGLDSDFAKQVVVVAALALSLLGPVPQVITT